MHLIATPCYDVPGCDGPHYSSFVLVRKHAGIDAVEALRGRTVAYNGPRSQSGYSALRALVAPHARAGQFFGETVKTGSHRASLRAVAEGRADVCAVDAVCWALARRHEPGAAGRLAVLSRTPSTPGLPLICAATHDPGTAARIREAVTETLVAGLDQGVRKALFLDGSENLAPAAYDRIAAMERTAVEAGYPALG